MITNDEAFELVRKSVGYDDSINISLEDFGPVCVATFSCSPKKKIPTENSNPSSINDSDRAGELSPPDKAELAEIVAENDDFVIDGLGPMLIDKRTAEVYETGSAVLYPSEHYVQSYLSCGNPNGAPTSRVALSGLADDCNTWAALKLIHTFCEVSTQQAKTMLEDVANGSTIEVKSGNAEQAVELAKQLREVGIDANQCWSSDSIAELPDEELYKLFDDSSVQVDTAEDQLPDVEKPLNNLDDEEE